MTLGMLFILLILKTKFSVNHMCKWNIHQSKLCYKQNRNISLCHVFICDIYFRLGVIFKMRTQDLVYNFVHCLSWILSYSSFLFSVNYPNTVTWVMMLYLCHPILCSVFSRYQIIPLLNSFSVNEPLFPKG